MIKDILKEKWFVNIPEFKIKKWKLTFWNDWDRFEKTKYDEYGRKVYLENNKWVMKWRYTVDNRVSYIYDNWYELWKKYNKDWKVIKQYDNNGVVNVFRYDRKWRIIYTMEQWPDGVPFETNTKFNRRWQPVHRTTTSWLEEQWEYDKKGREIFYKNSLWEEIRKEYDSKGRITKMYDQDWLLENNQYSKNAIHKEWRTFEFIKEWDLELEIQKWEEEKYYLNGFLLKTSLDSNE